MWDAIGAFTAAGLMVLALFLAIRRRAFLLSAVAMLTAVAFIQLPTVAAALARWLVPGFP